MDQIKKLFGSPLTVLNLGTETFKTDLLKQRAVVTQLDWKPPAGGNLALISALDKLLDNEKVDAANQVAVERLMNARPVFVDIDTALNVIPGMTKQTILHAGPPISWERMAGPMKGAIIGALLYEGMAKNPKEAEKLVLSGAIKFSPCHEHRAVGPMAGIISPSMPVQIIENKTQGNFSYATLNEGLGKVLRFGAFSEEVIARLRWMETELAPALKTAIVLSGGIDLRSLIAQALHMGDECHNRNKAATSLFIREIAPYLVKADLPRAVISRVLEFIHSNDHFFLNLSMPACKAALDAAQGVANSTMVTTLCRNGVDFGIRVSGCPGSMWFTGPALYVQGLLFPGFTAADANPDLGDSAITETSGIGGFAMAGAPAIVQFVGGTVADALNYTTKMYEITIGENTQYSIPNLNFRGTPTGIDVRKVIETGLLPTINTGIAHKDAGVGQVGAGVVTPPRECFEKALLALAERIK
jgi:hypothetical protein